jgi:hypothetical protein
MGRLSFDSVFLQDFLSATAPYFLERLFGICCLQLGEEISCPSRDSFPFAREDSPLPDDDTGIASNSAHPLEKDSGQGSRYVLPEKVKQIWQGWGKWHRRELNTCCITRSHKLIGCLMGLVTFPWGEFFSTVCSDFHAIIRCRSRGTHRYTDILRQSGSSGQCIFAKEADDNNLGCYQGCCTSTPSDPRHPVGGPAGRTAAGKAGHPLGRIHRRSGGDRRRRRGGGCFLVLATLGLRNNEHYPPPPLQRARATHFLAA